MDLLWFGVKSGSETNRVYVDTHQNSYKHNILCICSSRLERGRAFLSMCANKQSAITALKSLSC